MKFGHFLLKHSLDFLDLELPKNPLGTLWKPLKHFRNLLEPMRSQGELKGVNVLGTNRTERKEKYNKTLRYQGNSMEPPGNS